MHGVQVGEDMPGNAHTMIGLKRLQNIEDCVGAVIDDKVEGALPLSSPSHTYVQKTADCGQ